MGRGSSKKTYPFEYHHLLRADPVDEPVEDRVLGELLNVSGRELQLQPIHFTLGFVSSSLSRRIENAEDPDGFGRMWRRRWRRLAPRKIAERTWSCVGFRRGRSTCPLHFKAGLDGRRRVQCREITRNPAVPGAGVRAAQVAPPGRFVLRHIGMFVGAVITTTCVGAAVSLGHL